MKIKLAVIIALTFTMASSEARRVSTKCENESILAQSLVNICVFISTVVTELVNAGGNGGGQEPPKTGNGS